MAKIVLITGGCRSGKSAYAQQIAESLPPERLYVATCPVTDEEMRRRIEQHQSARRGRGWHTVEQQNDLPRVFHDHQQYNVLLVDCVTLWVNNLMYHAEREGHDVTEADVAQQCGRLLEAAQAHRGTAIFVTNEVGMGVVPDNAAARRYRDLVGRANQAIASAADSVSLMSCGIPLSVKDSREPIESRHEFAK
jgi:adenosylcobinamide kinase / adenosylcobinamide-phosphate guanylyltransferase